MAQQQRTAMIRLVTNNDRMRRKAFKIASGIDGVDAVSWEGQERDLMVKGVFDSVALTQKLRSKLQHAQLISVTPVQAQGSQPAAAAAAGGGGTTEPARVRPVPDQYCGNPVVYEIRDAYDQQCCSVM